LTGLGSTGMTSVIPGRFGQPDVFPVIQFEKLWGDMTALPDLDCRYLAVPRLRGQQLKDVSELDGWLRDGSAEYIEKLCDLA
jgi:hypothetical protein